MVLCFNLAQSLAEICIKTKIKGQYNAISGKFFWSIHVWSWIPQQIFSSLTSIRNNLSEKYIGHNNLNIPVKLKADMFNTTG